MSETIVVAPPAAGGPASPDFALRPGARLLQRYRLVRVLGRGSFGITYEAEDERLARRVAVKEYFPVASAARATGSATVRPHDADEARTSFGDGLKRFWREGQTLARLDHPGIVRVHDVLSENGTAYLVMEMVPGDPLASLLKRRRPDPRTVERLTRDLLAALAELHAAGIVHCDIKPGNIMVRPDGRPVLIDLGSARTDRRVQANGLTTVALAVTPQCAAPELFLENPPRIQAAADLFALGHTVYEMVVGAPPPATAVRLASRNNLQGDPLAPLEVRRPPGYSRRFLAAADQALALRLEDRLATAQDWLARLGADGTPSRRRPWLAACALAGLGGAAPFLATAPLSDTQAVAAGLTLAGGTLVALAGRLSAAGVLVAMAAVPALVWAGARLGDREALVRLGHAAWTAAAGGSLPGLDAAAAGLTLVALWRAWAFLRRRLGGIGGTLAVLPGLALLAGFADRTLGGSARLSVEAAAVVAAVTGSSTASAGGVALGAWSLQMAVLALALLLRAEPPLPGERP